MATTTRLRSLPPQMLAEGPIAEAAKRLAKSLGSPRSHSVWVRNELGPEMWTLAEDGGERLITEAEFKRGLTAAEGARMTPIPRTITPIICVARHPRFGTGLVIPATWEGFAVREEEWS
jgi:hypothetical protein